MSNNNKIEEEEEEDSKLPAVENFGGTNSFFQADWGHRINQDNIINSRDEFRKCTPEESFLFIHFNLGRENSTSGDSTPGFILA